MLNFLRFIPHLKYGNYGGAGRHNWDKDPVDYMDKLFLKHDLALKAIDDKIKELKEQKQIADDTLAKDLLEVRPKKIYGKFYRFFAKIVFQPKKEKTKNVKHRREQTRI